MAWIDGPRRAVGDCETARTLAVALVLALAGAGCAPVAMLPYRDTQPPTVSLPLALAGIADARAGFARLFAAELRASRSTHGDTDTALWLHGGFAAQDASIDRDTDIAFAARAASTTVLIVPGMFGDCVDTQSVPFGDGLPRPRERNLVDSYRQYDDLGLRSIEAIALPSRVSSADNGRRLAARIRAEAARAGVEHIVLIGYSKGLVDTLHALAELERDGGVPAQVAAVVSLAGAVMGTPVADHYERLYQTLSPLVNPLDCTPSDGHDLASLTRRERVAWLAANPPPAGVRYYSIVSHAPRDQIAPGLRLFYDLLAGADPRNDGQLIAGDAVLPGSTLLAEARADHWDLALPINLHPSLLVRSLTSGRAFPRDALFRATIRWVIGGLP